MGCQPSPWFCLTCWRQSSWNWAFLYLPNLGAIWLCRRGFVQGAWMPSSFTDCLVQTYAGCGCCCCSLLLLFLISKPKTLLLFPSLISLDFWSPKGGIWKTLGLSLLSSLTLCLMPHYESLGLFLSATARRSFSDGSWVLILFSCPWNGSLSTMCYSHAGVTLPSSPALFTGRGILLSSILSSGFLLSDLCMVYSLTS